MHSLFIIAMPSGMGDLMHFLNLWRLEKVQQVFRSERDFHPVILIIATEDQIEKIEETLCEHEFFPKHETRTFIVSMPDDCDIQCLDTGHQCVKKFIEGEVVLQNMLQQVRAIFHISTAYFLANTMIGKVLRNRINTPFVPDFSFQEHSRGAVNDLFNRRMGFGNSCHGIGIHDYSKLMSASRTQLLLAIDDYSLINKVLEVENYRELDFEEITKELENRLVIYCYCHCETTLFSLLAALLLSPLGRQYQKIVFVGPEMQTNIAIPPNGDTIRAELEKIDLNMLDRATLIGCEWLSKRNHELLSSLSEIGIVRGDISFEQAISKSQFPLYDIPIWKGCSYSDFIAAVATYNPQVSTTLEQVTAVTYHWSEEDVDITVAKIRKLSEMLTPELLRSWQEDCVPFIKEQYNFYDKIPFFFRQSFQVCELIQALLTRNKRQAIRCIANFSKEDLQPLHARLEKAECHDHASLLHNCIDDPSVPIERLAQSCGTVKWWLTLKCYWRCIIALTPVFPLILPGVLLDAVVAKRTGHKFHEPSWDSTTEADETSPLISPNTFSDMADARRGHLPRTLLWRESKKNSEPSSPTTVTDALSTAFPS